MTKQLSKEELEILKADLAQYGLTVTKLREPKATNPHLARIRAWKPETPAGSKCKSRMLMYAKLPPVKGVTDYAVRGPEGNWVKENEQGFARAVEWQKLCEEHASLINPNRYDERGPYSRGGVSY